jgi:hypothetical protein
VLDSAAILTPVLVLGVLLLLGYAGCAEIGDPIGPAHFYIVVRVPTAFMVTMIEYSYVRPDGDSSHVEFPNPSAFDTEGAYNSYRYECGPGVIGDWSVGCGVSASEAGIVQHSDSQNNPAKLDGTEQQPRARFEAGGSPARGEFAVIYIAVEDL